MTDLTREDLERLSQLFMTAYETQETADMDALSKAIANATPALLIMAERTLDAESTLAGKDARIAELERLTTPRETIAQDIRIAELRGALDQIMETLTIPAAEYVPAIGDVFFIIQRALRRAGGVPQPSDPAEQPK